MQGYHLSLENFALRQTHMRVKAAADSAQFFKHCWFSLAFFIKSQFNQNTVGS